MKKIFVLVIASAFILWGLSAAGASMQPPKRATTTAPQADRIDCSTLSFHGPGEWTVRTDSGQLVKIGTSPAEDGPISWADESGRIAAQSCGLAQNASALGAFPNPVSTGYGRTIDGRMVPGSDVPACQTLDYSGRTGSWSVFVRSGELALIGWASAEDSPIVWASERGKALGLPCLPD